MLIPVGLLRLVLVKSYNATLRMHPDPDEEAANLIPSKNAPAAADVSFGDTAPQEWRGGLFDCFMHCDINSWASVALVHTAPCVAFGFNVKRGLRLSSVWRAIAYFFLLVLGGYVHYALSCYAIYQCAVSDNNPGSAQASQGCAEAVRLTNIVRGLTFVLAIMGVLYASRMRSQIRTKFGIKGSYLGDCCAWMWCTSCALCQETRTLMHNNVTDGAWLGPTYLNFGKGASAGVVPRYNAPTINEMV